MHFEGSLTQAEEDLRDPVYEALRSVNIVEILRILTDEKAAGEVMALVDDGEQPFVARARRILRTDQPLLRKGAISDEDWTDFVDTLSSLLTSAETNVDAMIYDEYNGEVWTKIRGRYREEIKEKHPVWTNHSFYHSCQQLILNRRIVLPG
jgi:hypothetical protein